MKNFNTSGIHWKIWFLEGGSWRMKTMHKALLLSPTSICKFYMVGFEKIFKKKRQKEDT